MQHIGIQLNDENGQVIETSTVNFAEIMDSILKDADFKSKYPLVATIDPYGDTVFNVLQIPVVVKELESLPNSNESTVKDVISFLSKSAAHLYIKFIGD